MHKHHVHEKGQEGRGELTSLYMANPLSLERTETKLYSPVLGFNRSGDPYRKKLLYLPMTAPVKVGGIV